MEKKMLTIEILQHNIKYWIYGDDDIEMDESDIEYVTYMITEGYNQGELNHGQEELRGWWSIDKKA